MHLAHCPERVLPGRIMIEIATNDRVIGGLTPACAARAAALYRTFCHGELLITDAASAEMAKLAENAYRDVNIAFANELSLICQRLGLDVWEIRQLANHHPRVDILRPGPGVGGHCIAVDPWFIVDAAPEQATLIAAAARRSTTRCPRTPPSRSSRPPGGSATRASPAWACRSRPTSGTCGGARPWRSSRQVAAELPDAKVLAVEPHAAALPDELEALGNVAAGRHPATPSSDADIDRPAHRPHVLPADPAHRAGGQGRLRHPRPVGLSTPGRPADRLRPGGCTPRGAGNGD